MSSLFFSQTDSESLSVRAAFTTGDTGESSYSTSDNSSNEGAANSPSPTYGAHEGLVMATSGGTSSSSQTLPSSKASDFGAFPSTVEICAKGLLSSSTAPCQNGSSNRSMTSRCCAGPDLLSVENRSMDHFSALHLRRHFQKAVATLVTRHF